MLLASAYFSLSLFYRQRAEKDSLIINKFPYELGDWKSTDIKLTEREYGILETRNILMREYVNSKNESQKVYLFIICSETNRSVFHPPEVCLVGDGVNIDDKTTEKVSVKNYDFLVNKLYTDKSGKNQIILYCYKAGKLYTENFYLQQLAFTFNQVFNKDKSGATIRVAAEINGDKEETLSMLKQFMSESISIINNL
jgi:EpsI family protein